jgi:hypothetical protein
MFAREPAGRVAPSVPILLGFHTPANAEMASPIRPAAARNVRLTSELGRRVVVIRGDGAVNCLVETQGVVLEDEQTRTLPSRTLLRNGGASPVNSVSLPGSGPANDRNRGRIRLDDIAGRRQQGCILPHQSTR